MVVFLHLPTANISKTGDVKSTGQISGREKKEGVSFKVVIFRQTKEWEESSLMLSGSQLILLISICIGVFSPLPIFFVYSPAAWQEDSCFFLQCSDELLGTLTCLLKGL